MFDDTTSIALVGLTLAIAGAIAYFFLRPKPHTPTPTIALKPVLKPLTPLASSSSSSSSSSAASRKPKSQSGPSFKILYATQTGTAEEFASTIASEGASKKFNIDTVNVSDYDPDDLLNEKFVIFVSSTYGDGEPPDTAKDFFAWLQSEDRQPDCLSGLSFTIFGLGDKTYEKFCAASRIIEERVKELGGKLIYSRGEGDNDGSIQEDFDQWKTRLWEPVASFFGVDLSALENEEFKPFYALKTHKPGSVTLNESVVWFKKSTLGENNINNPVKCTISSSKQLHTEKSDRSCLHIEINLKSTMRYEAGDHLGIYPQNPADLVKEFAERIGANLDEIISLRPASDPKMRPALGPCTVEKALRCYVNLSEIPSKKLLKVLADKFTSDPAEKEALLELAASSEKGWELYKAQVQGRHLTTLEVLRQNESCKPTLDHLLELLPAMQPRFYSISSCPAVHPSQAHVTAVVVEYVTPTGRVHKGVCTNYLASLRDGDSLYCFTRTSSFKLANHSKRGSVIMVGPGTGVAPFRGFIEQLSLDHKPESGNKNLLFFGCRARDVDFLYREELEGYVASGILSELIVAFSREQAAKVYVQDKIKDHGAAIWSLLLEPSSALYICGDARHMAKDVQKALKQIAMDFGGKSQAEADSFFTQLQTSNRMMLDIWT